MITIPAGQCHWCNSWKENDFGRCERCRKFQPPKYRTFESFPVCKHVQLQASILKYLFLVLKHVRFFVRAKFDFRGRNLFEIRDLVYDAYLMTLDPEYKSQEHPDLFLEDLIAAILYKLGVPESVTGFIDDVTIMYGYGKCDSIGTWEYTIPHRFLKPGTTLRSLYTTMCDLNTRQESIAFHAYKEVA